MAEETTSKGVFPEKRAKHIDNFARRLVHNPRLILRGYVKKGMTVIDIGCGPGVFSVPMARMVGNKGKVIAADIQKAMLDRLKAKIKGTKLEKIITLHKSEAHSLGITEKADFILAFYVVHEVPSQESLFRELSSILKPGGKILVVEPNFRVSEEGFKETLKTAKRSGLAISGKKRVLFSRAAVLAKQQ